MALIRKSNLSLSDKNRLVLIVLCFRLRTRAAPLVTAVNKGAWCHSLFAPSAWCGKFRWYVAV